MVKPINSQHFSKNVVQVYAIFDNIFQIENDFTKYLKEL